MISIGPMIRGEDALTTSITLDLIWEPFWRLSSAEVSVNYTAGITVSALRAWGCFPAWSSTWGDKNICNAKRPRPTGLLQLKPKIAIRAAGRGSFFYK